jgi:hypothetical protein
MAVPALPLILALEGLTKTLTGIKDQFKAAMDFADKAQKSSLALGKTYEQTRKDLGGTMQGLRGDITQKFQAGLAGLEEGLQGNTAGVARLINQQQMTGTSFANTAKSMAKLESSLGLSRDQTNVLANSLIATSQTWNISTDKLVDAIDALAATFPAQDLAGMGDKVVGAVASLQAELGPQLAGPLNAVMKAVMDTSQEGYASLVRMGIGDIRERLSAAKNQEEALKILKEGIQRAANNVQVLAGGADKFFGQIGVAQRVMGAASLDFTTVAKNFGKRIGDEQKAARDFGQTLENLKNEIFTPFQEGLANAYPFLVKLADVFSAVVNVVGTRFREWTDTLGGSGETIKNWQLKIIDFARWALPKLENAFTFGAIFIEKGIPLILDKIEEGFYEFIRPGGVLTQLKSGFYSFLAVMSDALQFFATGAADDALMKAEAEYDLRVQQLDAEVEANKLNTYENMKKGLVGSKDTTSPLGLVMKEAADAVKANGKEQEKMLNRLEKLRESVVAGQPLAREGNDSLEEAKKRLANIDGKTADMNATQSSFLKDSTMSIASTLERIVGVRSGDTSEELIKTLQKQIEIQTETLENQKKATEYADINNRLIAVQGTQTVGIKNQSGGRKN